MSDTRTDDRRPAAPDPTHPPFHVILSYLLGTWADLRVVDAGRDTRNGKETRR